MCFRFRRTTESSIVIIAGIASTHSTGVQTHNNSKMSTDLVDPNNRQTAQPIDQWFWPTSALLSPLMDSNSKAKSVDTLPITTSVSSNATYHRRHRHWWKVCWIYNNGNFVYQSKQSNFKQFHQQIRSFAMCSTNTGAIFNDRCVKKDDHLFSSMAKHNNSAITEPEVHISSESQHSLHSQPKYPQLPHLPHPDPLNRQTLPALPALGSTSLSITSCSPQISSSATSGFLQQRLTQPLTALLKQKSEHKNSTISQFFTHFKGPEWRAEQLQYQMPAHDVQMFKLQTNEVKFVRNQQRKAQIKPQLFLNKSLNYCFKCKNAIENGSYGVKISVLKNGNQNNGYNTTTDDEDSAAFKPNPSSDTTHPTLNGSTALYHIQCFTCEECQQVLVDLKAFLYTNTDPNERLKANPSLYCGRHFVELFKPRCRHCDHLIFDEECTEAEGKAWHLGHFCCTECKRSLGGQQYIMANPSKQIDKKSIIETKSQLPAHLKDHQLPYCLTCFDILFGELCEECGELIGCDVGAISHEGRSWHAIDVCFKCNMCSKPLLGKPFLPAFDGKIYCSITCSQESIQRNRYRDRRKQRSITTSAVNTNNDINNDLLQKSEKCQNNSQIDGQMKPKLQMRENQQIYSQKPSEDKRLPINGLPTNGLPVNGLPNNRYQTNDKLNEFPQMFSEIKLNEMKTNCELDSNKSNDCMISMENNRISPNITNFEQNLTNGLFNQQMFDYIQKYQQLNKPPNQVLDYMKQQLLRNDMNGQNEIIGATVEYGSSYSEDERINQQMGEHKNPTHNDINYNQLTSMTSSTSSSLNTNPFETNNSVIQSNAFKYNPLTTHSSSSNETTPLLLRSLEERAKHLQQIHNQSDQVLSKPKIFSEQSFPSSESPSQTSQADQSSNSSYIENNNKINETFRSQVMADLKNIPEADTPSTQSTALQSTSSQTTPETNPRSANKSVTFDPSVKETTGKRMNRKSSKSRPQKRSEWKEWKEWSDSCSTCSTCSSSSSDDNFDYDSTLERNRNQWLGTKIHYVTNDRKRNMSLVPENGSQSESCTIS